MEKKTIESGIKVLLVGAGQGGKALLNMFLGDPSITVTGVADIDENAPGLIIAKRANIPTDSDFRNLILDNSMDLIVDVTGDPGVHESLQQLKPRQVELIGAASAGFIKALVSALKQKEILEEKYDLMLRELEVQSKGEFIIGADPRMQEIADQWRDRHWQRGHRPGDPSAERLERQPFGHGQLHRFFSEPDRKRAVRVQERRFYRRVHGPHRDHGRSTRRHGLLR